MDSIKGILSKREYDVVRLVAAGMSNKEIASRLFISETTVKNCLSAIYSKLGVENKTKLIIFAVGNNIK